MLDITSICSFFSEIGDAFVKIGQSTGIGAFFDGSADPTNLIMVLISFVLVYLAVVKKFEPLLLLPIAFGMFIVNVPGAYRILFGDKGYIVTDLLTNQEVARGSLEEIAKLLNVGATEEAIKATFASGSLEEIAKLYNVEATEQAIKAAFASGVTLIGNGNNVVYSANVLSLSSEQVIGNYGLFYYIYKGVDWVIFPPIIFLGIGAMTDFGPMIANPKSMLIGAAAQLGVFLAYFFARLIGFTGQEAGAIGIIGGADGPTAIYVTKKLAEDLLPAIAIAAYSYMALIPMIQKPIMKLLTTEKERKIKMKQLRKVSKVEKVVFPLLVTLVVGLILPDAIPLLGMLMFGNLMKESGVTERLVTTATGGLMNTITIFLGLMVGSKAVGKVFLSPQTLYIIALGLTAFCFGTVGGLLVAKLMNKLEGGNSINPLFGSAGVSAVPMAARISQDVGREYDPNNHLLMHAMGPNVAGVIGSAIAAGVLLAMCG